MAKTKANRFAYNPQGNRPDRQASRYCRSTSRRRPWSFWISASLRELHNTLRSSSSTSASYGYVRQRCEARPLLLEHGEDFVLYALLDFVTENYQPVSEAIHAEIDELERNVLCSSLSERDIQNLHGLRRDVLRLKRYVAPMVEISQELQKLSFPFIDKNMRPYFRDVQIHVTRQMEDLTTLRDIASQTIEIGVLLEASRQSVVQRKFAAWAAILAFPTAVAGIYGMNFQNMPELQWHYGYFAVLGFIAVGCTSLWASFKRSGWL